MGKNIRLTVSAEALAVNSLLFLYQSLSQATKDRTTLKNRQCCIKVTIKKPVKGRFSFGRQIQL